MPTEYYLDNLDPISFQRLINALLTSRFGEAIRLLPLRGRDGGRDAETAPFSLLSEVVGPQAQNFFPSDHPLRGGRYLFQVKHHRTIDRPTSVPRAAVVADFEAEVRANVHLLNGVDRVDCFFLITNVPASRDAVSKVDEKRRELLRDYPRLHADVLWQEQVFSWLDQLPNVWHAFPEIFAGMQVPLLGQVADRNLEGLPRAFRAALNTQFTRDGVVRFRQINLEQRLAKLFVDLDIRVPRFIQQEVLGTTGEGVPVVEMVEVDFGTVRHSSERSATCLAVLADDSHDRMRKLIVEGGPGQGKSTVTQMLAQLYRESLLQQTSELAEYRRFVRKARFPVRIELRLFAEWISEADRSVEQYIAELFSKDSGGTNITVEKLQDLAEHSPMLLIFDGLDEVGSDELRDLVLARISECVERFQNVLKSNLRVIITSRSPAIAGRSRNLSGFESARIQSLSDSRIDEYVRRWTDVQCTDASERERIVVSFNRRRSEKHVGALAKNPMQLSVLLHFIRLKGEAFPDRRAELYREYFKTVIDRDVEKSPELRNNRDAIESLHEAIGFEIHSRAESDTASSSLKRADLLNLVENWLRVQGPQKKNASDLFRIGEERLGLVVALKGEGTESRYGFEIQPVREYFAAAFINDKCEGDAHDIFQAMIRRPFWREVALFLAGLRRANEKADLLSRARALDEDPSSGWRQDGLGITFQLLQEGVLSTPGHVRRDAVSFLIASLDTANTTPRHEHREVKRVLPSLLLECENAEHERMLGALLVNAARCSDEHAVSRLHYVTNKVLPRETVALYASEFTSSRKDLEARVKLLWPARDGVVDRESVFMSAVATNLSPHFAEMWFQAALKGAQVLEWEETIRWHAMLFEQLAFSQLSLIPLPVAGTVDREFHSRHRYAVWVLCANLRAICTSLGTQCAPEIADRLARTAEYGGLPADLAQGVRSLVESSAAAARELILTNAPGNRVREFLGTVEDLLGHDGLMGWIACRCALTIMQQVEGPQSYYRLAESAAELTSPARALFAQKKSWLQLRRLLTPFFRSAIPIDLNKAGQTFAGRLVRAGLAKATPSHVRVGGEFASVPAGILESVLGEKEAVLPWLARVPISHYWIRDMICLDRLELSVVLGQVAQRRVSLMGPPVALGMLDIHRVVAAVREFGDPAVAAGGLFFLLGSSFHRIAGEAVTLKMIEADAGYCDVGSQLFFNRGGFRNRTNNIEHVSSIASTIIRELRPVSQATATAAARFLVEHEALNLDPLRNIACVKRTLDSMLPPYQA